VRVIQLPSPPPCLEQNPTGKEELKPGNKNKGMEMALIWH